MRKKKAIITEEDQPTVPNPPLTEIEDIKTGPLPAIQPPRSRRRRWKGALVVLAVLALLALAAPLAITHLNKSIPRVTLYTVRSQRLASYVGGGGLTYPIQSMNIALPISSQVVSVAVQVGQMVQAGQTLITLNNAALAAQLQQAYNQWQAAQQNVNNLIAAGAPPAQIAAAQQQAASAKSRYDALNAQMNAPGFNQGNITAPFAGVITMINVAAGSQFKANAPLMTLEDISTIIVRAQFPLEERAQIQLGAAVAVDPSPVGNQSFTGKVTAINPALSTPGSATFEVWITVPNPGLAIFTGESVYARVLGEQVLPTVPELAVINPESDSIVFVYAGGRAHLRRVVVGARSGDQFGISSGLRPGDQVILTGQDTLTDNEPVIVSAIHP